MEADSRASPGLSSDILVALLLSRDLAQGVLHEPAVRLAIESAAEQLFRSRQREVHGLILKRRERRSGLQLDLTASLFHDLLLLPARLVKKLFADPVGIPAALL